MFCCAGWRYYYSNCIYLARAATLTEAFPGKPLYVTDEYEKRTVKLNVSAEGYVPILNCLQERRI